MTDNIKTLQFEHRNLPYRLTLGGEGVSLEVARGITQAFQTEMSQHDDFQDWHPLVKLAFFYEIAGEYGAIRPGTPQVEASLRLTDIGLSQRLLMVGQEGVDQWEEVSIQRGGDISFKTSVNGKTGCYYAGEPYSWDKDGFYATMLGHVTKEGVRGGLGTIAEILNKQYASIVHAA